MQRIVIFDMDGTLLDSQKDITISINHVRKINHNLPPLSEAFVVESINKEVRDLPYLFYETHTYEDADKELFESHYAKQCAQNLYLYNGIKELLVELQAKGVKLAVATNAPTKFAQAMLHTLEVENFFGIIVGADQVAHSKPSPEMLERILEFYEYDPARDRAWMVGDNSKDMHSATNAKIEGVFATWGFSPNSDGFRAIDTPKELLSTIF